MWTSAEFHRNTPFLRVSVLMASLLLAPAIARCATPSADEIIKKSVVASQRDWDAEPGFAYKEREREGKGTKTYDVTLVQGSPYRRLIMVNGKPLSPEDQAAEDKKYQEMLAERSSESPQDRVDRIAKYQADRRRDHLMLDQLTRAFNFKLVSKTRMGPYAVYVLRGSPRKGYQPPNVETQALLGMQGQLWIDQKTFQWVKAAARVIRPVSIEGILAQVEPGTRFELEKMPVSGDIWLPEHFSMKSRSKIFFLFNYNTQADQTYFDYRPQ